MCMCVCVCVPRAVVIGSCESLAKILRCDPGWPARAACSLNTASSL